MANHKTLGVNLAFTADTRAAKTELEQLKRSLLEISNTTAMKTPNFALTDEIQEASRAAAQLKVSLENATNVSTGQLDLTKFNDALKKSGMSLEKYQNQLYQLGPTGEKAFVNLTKAITTAEVPLRRNSKLLNELWITLKNTAKWQLSSSLMHGFMGALQSAYGYAQDLNGSLNDIRIVTGASADKMADFAKEANKAAKALSTTTNEYAKASLIFYQQGLSSGEVTERTNITIKMANAAGASAQQVSDQLTAVWNNFYDGSKSLEFYADAMTALGAATASSTDEIADGLEKFAAIADTVGLSYEYAAAALATVTATTRQSADVVGTAFKTLFARLQDLELGKTLDDGTSLGKYSAALNAVGINIKDTSGEMKRMDTILDELGGKWQGLTKDTQIALAETVAGTRQYTQLVALMDNWKFFQENLGTVNTSEGTLDKQAEIYAESWEAASKRAQASAEAVYDTILDDEFFIKMTNSFAGLLDGVKLFIDSLGGVKGVLLAVGSIVTNIFSKQIGQSIDNFVYNMKMRLPGAAEAALAQKKAANQLLIDSYKDSGDPNAQAYVALAQNQMSYIDNASRMSEEEQALNQILMDRNRLLADEVIKANEKLKLIKEQIVQERKSLKVQAEVAASNNPKSKTHGTPASLGKSVAKHQKNVEKLTQSYSLLNAISTKLELAPDADKSSQEFKLLEQSIRDVLIEFAELDGLNTEADFIKLGQALGISAKEAKAFKAALDGVGNTADLNVVISDLSEIARNDSATAIQKLRNALTNCTGDVDKANAMMAEYLATLEKFGPESVEASNALTKLNNAVKTHGEQMDKTIEKPIGLAESFTKAASAVMAMGQTITTVQGIIDVFNDSEATTGDKIMSLVMGIGMLIPAIMAIAPAFSTASVGATLFGTTATAAGTAASLAMWQVTLIVAAITAIVAVVALLVTQESAAEKQAKAAAKAAEEMGEAAEEAAQSLEDIKSAFEAYDTAVAKLEECTKGTEEWNEALAEVNKTVLKILQDIPQLAQYEGLFYRDLETGMLTINEEMRETVLNAADTYANLTSALSVVSSAKSSVASAELQREQIKNNINANGYYNYGIGNSVTVDTTKNSNGTYNSRGYVKTTYDDYINVGEILSANAEQLLNLTDTEYREKVAELLKNAASDQAKTYEGLDAQIDVLVEHAMQYQDSLDMLAQESVAAATQIRTAFQLLTDQQLGTSYGAAEKTMAGYDLEKRTEELTVLYKRLAAGNSGEQKKYADEYEKLGFTGSYGINKASNASNDIYQFLAKKLNEAGTGLSAATGNTVLGTDTNRRFIFQDANGEKTEEKTAEWVAQTIAAAEALKELQGNAEAASKTLDAMDANIAKWNFGGSEAQDVQEEALRGFIANGNFDGHSMGDFDAFYRAVAQGNPEGISTGSASKADVSWYVDKMFGDGKDGMISDETAKKYGYETGQEMIDAFYEKISDQAEAWETIDLPDNLLGIDGLMIKTASALDQIYKDLNIGPLGEKAGQEFTAGLNKMLEDVDAEKQSDALVALSTVDWSSWDALDQADAIMKEFGVDIDTNTDYWKSFADQMRIASGAVPDYSKLKIDLTEISAIIQDMDFGDIIDEEDYQRLIAYNDEWERFFQLQADGTRRFIGNSDDMLQETRDDINEKRKVLQARMDAQAGFDRAGWGHSDENGNWVKADWASKTGNDTGSARNLLKANGATQDMLDILGYDDKTLSEIIDKAEQGNENAKAQLTEMYQRMASFQKEDLSTQQSELDEMMASTATSIEELNKMQKEGLVGSKWGKSGEVTAYEKQLKYLTTTALNTAESLEELNTAWSKNSSVKDAQADIKVYRENLQRLAEQYSTASEELEAYQKAIESNDTKAIKAAENTLKNAIQLGEAANQYGVNADELEKLTREMMDSSNMGFNAAMKTAIGYMTLADELGISVEELQNTLATLTASFDDLKTAEIDALFTQISDKAKELGVSVTELAEQVASLGTQFGVSGEDALEMATLFTQANSDLGVSNDELIIQTQNIASEFNLSAKAAAKLAVENQRMNKGVAALTENWQDWKNTLKTADKTSTDYAKAMGELTQVVRDLTGAGDDFVMTSEFLEENMELIEQAANGDEKAINMLGVATAKATVSAMEFSQEFADAMNKAAQEAGIDSPFEHLSRDFETNKSIVEQGINDLMNAVANGTAKVGSSISFLGDDWISALNEMAIQTGMSVEEMNSLLNQMGVDADVTVTEVPTKTKVPVYRTEEEVIEDGSNGPKVTETKTSVTRYEEMDGMIQVASINADSKVTYTGNGAVSASSKTSGGGSTKKPAKAEKKQTKERYTKVTEQLDDTANAMGDANREMDTLYGAGRIAKMSQVNKLLGDEVKLLEAKTQEAKKYLKEDKKAMENAFKDAGVKNLEFDANGNVSNIESVLDGLDAEYNKLVADYNRKAKNAWDNDNVISGNEQKSLDALKERMDEKAAEIDAAKAAYDQYADTLNVIAETEDQILEKQNEVRANNYQKMVDNLNLALEGTTAETQEIDYYLNKIADDFYKMSEAAALTESKMGVATEVLALQKQHADGLASAYAKGNITQADYVAGLGETRDAIYGELESLQSLDKEMQDYYGNTLSAAGEELDKYTERMDHLNSVLDHYQSLLSIIGQETDYKAMGIVLQGIADGAENSLAVAKAEYAFYAGEAEKKKALMESVPKDSAAFEQYKKEWEAAEAASREAQDNMLSATAEWAEAMKSVLTNELSDFASTLEKQLTGGTSFDEMTTSIERAASLQEDYLTTTNQIYETTKMMRVAEKALDETTSTAAKNKLKGFLESTKQLQNQEKLSKFELDMQQKKYDLLLAEIALEEAQNAKSTVRLQRNAEGGFGYVYTADANQVADAQQKVDDAENALYNAGLEGANDFAQKQAQIAQEGQDAIQALTDALANGEISLEDWQRRTAETQAHYAQKLQDYSNLYQVAISADSAIMQEAWAADFATMITDAETWSTSMDEYLANCEGSFQKWQETVAEVQNVVGSNYEEIAENVGAITDANDELTEEILAEGGVIETIGAEVTAVSDATEAYAAKRQAVLDLIETNENYIKSLNAIIAAESGTAIVGDTSDDVPTVTTPSGFDTGGYTGEWGPSGKLAVLHEKEIVLNATDTQNLLSIVEMLRTIDMHSLSAQIGGILSTPGFHGGDGGTLEQNVKIEASFPNVQDRNEIEEAFNNLINRASQYANRG